MSISRNKRAFFSFVCILLLFYNSNARNTQDEKHVEVALRMIGHQVLLNSNDSTSLVLPIIYENDEYRIQFENEFEFIPDELVATINRVVKETRIANNYIVEVEKCETGEVVYSYEVNSLEQSDIIACKARLQPKSCYSLLFTLMEIGETKDSLNNANTDPPDESFSESPMGNYTFIIVPFILIVGLFFFLWKRKSRLAIDPNVISLGKYRFNKKKAELILEQQKIELTSKEADLLLMLYNAVNTTVERELILNTVWGDDGDYIGRTLDVFISKLRKKLEADPSVKIVNIRGVGYKLVLDE